MTPVLTDSHYLEDWASDLDAGTRVPADAPEKIVVSSATVEQLANLFERTWQRPPTPHEIDGLIDDHVREEVFYREAKKLGLDQNDLVIRRRLRAKMEFIDDNSAALAAPSDAELERYMADNRSLFEIEPRFAFRQIFLDAKSRGATAKQAATQLLAQINADPALDTSSLGDPTLLPPEIALTAKSRIAREFGAPFAAAIALPPQAEWTGPVESAYGTHLVLVTLSEPGRLPALAQARDVVLREWTNARRAELLEANYARHLARYSVTVERPVDAGQ
jgi:hypothetical protein